MENAKPIRSTIAPLALACALVALTAANAAAQSNSSGGFFSGLFGHSSTPAANDASQTDDNIALDKGQKKPGVELYVAVAHLYTETGKYAEADDEYRQAMKVAPDDLRVLLGYAMLKDQVNQPDEALKLYQEAEQKHPKEPSVYNNLAIHFVRAGMVREAIEAAQHAVDLRPQEPRYRNNLAALFVEAGRPQEAFRQLRAVYDEPVAHYNLGFLLNKRGVKPLALQEFAIALQMNPNLVAARRWVERLSQETSSSGTALGTMPPQRPAAMLAPPPYYPPGQVPAGMAGPPQYAAPQYAGPPPYPLAPSPPGQAQNAVPQQFQPQNVQPSNQAPPPPYQPPQYQVPPPAAPAPANGVPLMAAREPAARSLPPSASDAGNLRRLPPVNDPADGQNSEVAPDPPNLQR